MRKPVKRTKNPPRRFRLSVTTVIVATAIIAIGAVTVISRQTVKGEAANNQERRSLVANNADKADKNFVTVKVAGQDVQVDPQTGRMKELTPEEAQKMAAGLKKLINQSSEGLVQVQHADGTVSMDLEGRFQNVTVARVNKDGTVSQSCVDNPKAAGAFFGIDPKLIENQPDGSQRRKPSPNRN
ncbi:MAG: post-PEP-CTERM-1 domain-containing protein [Pyrinomonadaceae bacterium]